MYVRTSTLANSKTLMNYLFENEAKYNKTSQQVASGERVSTPSDDAMAAVGILNSTKTLNMLNSYINNMANAQNELNVVDGTLKQATTYIQRANDLTITASNETNSPESLKAIKTEIDSIIEGLASLGNTKYNDKYIFAGTNTTTTPFQEIATGGYSYNGTPATGDYARKIEISEGEIETINTTGDALFGYYDKDHNTGSGIIQTLSKLSEALEAGNYTDIRASLDGIDAGLQTVTDTRTKFASISNRFDMTTSTLDSNVLSTTTYKSQLQDIDYAEAVSNLTLQQYALQASLAVAGKTASMSLMNYL